MIEYVDSKNGVDFLVIEDFLTFIVYGEPSNEWWKSFPESVTDFTYLFVTSYLKGKLEDNLQSIHANTGVNGGAVVVNNLLYLAEDMKSGKMPYENFFNMMKNCELSA